MIIKVKFKVFSSLPLVSAPPGMINDLVDFLPVWLFVIVVSFICLFTLWKITFPTQKIEHFWKVINLKAKFICFKCQEEIRAMPCHLLFPRWYGVAHRSPTDWVYFKKIYKIQSYKVSISRNNFDKSPLFTTLIKGPVA